MPGVRSGALRRLDSPRLALTLTAIAYLLFIAAALRQHGYDPSYFVSAGDRFSDPSAVPENLLVRRNSDGYDGQFYYRLALDPFTNQRSDFGVMIDAPSYRHQRIMYPLLVWLPTRGDPDLVPTALVLVNYLALCMMGYVGAQLARAMGEHALWGLTLPLYPGFVLVLMRDLIEILAVCFMLASLLLLRHNRHAPATLVLTLAVLTRESTLLLAVAALLVRLMGAGKDATGGVPRWHLGLVPVGVCALWQALLWSHWGSVPLLSGNGPRSLPFVAFSEFLLQTAALDTAARRVWFVELCFLVAFVLVVAVSLPRSRATAHEKVSWILYLGLASVLGGDVWSGDLSFMRVLAELYSLGAIILLGSRFAGRVPVFIGSLGLWLLLIGSFAVGYR